MAPHRSDAGQREHRTTRLQLIRLNQTYKFNPIPEGADGRYILGGQGNLWTEQIYNMRQAEYMTWPRGLAIAESLWSPEGKKDYNNFIRKTENHFIRFDFAETNTPRICTIR